MRNGGCISKIYSIQEGYLESVEWNGGMEHWNGILEWNTGMGNFMLKALTDAVQQYEKCTLSLLATYLIIKNNLVHNITHIIHT